MAWTADSGLVTADSSQATADGSIASTGRLWPCDLLPTNPPSIADQLSSPTADDILPQTLALTPRGPAWGTDEAGDGRGASPSLLRVWRGLSSVFAETFRATFNVATQAIPTAITFSLPEWEAEYGLPDACLSPNATQEQRINAVRARFAATGGSSLGYFVCLARTLGYDIDIEEPNDFICDLSECDGEDTVVSVNGHHEWVIHLLSLGDTWFYPDDGELDETPLEGFAVAVDLECVLRREAPEHTTLIFDYSGVAA